MLSAAIFPTQLKRDLEAIPLEDHGGPKVLDDVAVSAHFAQRQPAILGHFQRIDTYSRTSIRIVKPLKNVE